MTLVDIAFYATIATVVLLATRPKVSAPVTVSVEKDTEFNHFGSRAPHDPVADARVFWERRYELYRKELDTERAATAAWLDLHNWDKEFGAVAKRVQAQEMQRRVDNGS